MTILALMGAIMGGTAAMARPVTDCPLRDAPFSIDLPVLDLLLSPAARQVIERRDPGVFSGPSSSFFTSTSAPTFAAIISFRDIAGMKKMTPQAIGELDSALRALPVTAADRATRCARYDDDRPSLSIPKGKPRLLLFEKINGYRDGPSVDAARAAFEAMARAKGWAVVVTDKGGAITPSILRRFDAVVWNNVSGDVLTLSQRAAFRSYIEQGGGFIGVHGSAGDPASFWDWYVDTLIGARFAGHPLKPQFQDARVVVEGATHPVAHGLPDAWVMQDEWYSFKTNPRSTGAHVIATLDEASYSPAGMQGQDLRMGDHPIAWTRCVGKGRMFYSAIGHRPQSYSEPHYVRMLENAVDWIGAKDDCRKDAASAPHKPD